MVAFFEVSRAASRRMRLAEELPTVHPPEFDLLADHIAGLPDPENLSAKLRVGSMRAMQLVRNMADAYMTQLAGAADRAHDARALRAGTTGTMVAVATGQNPHAGSASVATAAALQELAHVRTAFGAGRINSLHVRFLTDAAPRIDDFGSLEPQLVEIAASTEPRELSNMLSVIIAQCRPDESDNSHDRHRAKRGLSLSELPNGLFRLDGYLDDIEGRKLRDALSVFMDRRGSGDLRTAQQRRADAMADIVAAACANTRPLGVSGLSVLVNVENLPDGRNAILDDSTPLGSHSFDLLSCAAACSVIFGVNRQGVFVPLALGRSARRASAAQWAALVARDRGCIRCGRSPRFCEAHHVLHWKNGGLTDLLNLVLICSRCHHDLHFGHYTITMDTHGIPSIVANRGPPSAAR